MKLEARWKQETTRLKEFVQEPALLHPDVEVAKSILSTANRLVEIAEAVVVEKTAEEEFWREIVTLIKGHEEIYSEQVRLAEMRDTLTDTKRPRATPDDTKSTLTSIRENFASVEQCQNTVRNLQKQISSSSTNQLKELTGQLSSALQGLDNAVSKLEKTFGDLIAPESNNSSAALPEASEDDGSTDVQTTRDQNILGPSAFPTISPTPDSATDISEQDNSKGVPQQRDTKQEELETLEKAEVSTDDTGSKQTDLPIREQKEEKGSVDVRSGQEGRNDGGKVNSPVEELNGTTEGETKSVGLDTLSGEGAELLDTLLRDGQFARAYWVAYASDGLLDPNILGVLCEGGRIRPSEPCRGELARFLDNLAARQADWSDNESLLLSVALLQPILFLGSYPEALYKLANSSIMACAPLTDLIEYLRNICLQQGVKLEPEMINRNPEQSEIETQLRNLTTEAKDFLARIPQINFNYVPATKALQFLYRRGSELYRLHTVIGDNKRQRVQEIKELCHHLEPRDIVATVHQKPEIPELSQPIVSHARTKLIRYLYDSHTLATNWVALIEKLDSGHGSEKGTQRSADLMHQLEKSLPEIREALTDHRLVPAKVAARQRIAELENSLRGEDSPIIDVATACIDLPSIRLDDEMAPLVEELPNLVDAMNRLVNGKALPRDVFQECLERDELVRAERLLERQDLGNAAERLKEYRDKRRKQLEKILTELRMKVEDAFLLGELSDPSNQPAGGNVHLLTRSDLLSRIGEAESKLETGDTDLNANIGRVADIVQQIKNRVDEIVSNRQERLHEEKENLICQFPDNEQGREDRKYFEQAFLECLSQEDDVAAFDLLDRARRSITKSEPLAKATISSSDPLVRFLKQSEIYKKSLSQSKSLDQLREAIKRRETALGIPFGQLDDSRRKESIDALEGWGRLWNARLEQGSPSAVGTVEKICQFVGFPVDLGRARLSGTPREGMAHFSINLSAPVPDSPIPAFGSLLGSNLDVIVCQRQKEPEQITEFLQQAKIQQKAVLVLLMRPQSSNYRLKWQKHCAASRSMAMPLDQCLLVHLCGVRNRLPELLGVGLPFTWAHPYITKGETVAREMFVGRQDEVRDLFEDTGGCIVFGGRQLGKSALLTHVRRQYHDPEGGTFIAYIDVDNLGVNQTHEEMTEKFWEQVAKELIREGVITDIDKSTKRRKKYFSQTTRPAIERSLQEERVKRIILLLDESDDLLDCDSSLDFQLVRHLRALMAGTDRKFKVVFAGLQSVQRYNNWKNHPFAHLGTEITIDPLPPKAAQELIIRPFRSLGFAFESTRFVQRILSLTNYHPGLIQIFCYRLLEKLYVKWGQRDTDTPIRPISSDDVVAVGQDNSLREDIRNRFDWTLDLDDRYKVITYALVLSSDPNTPRSETKFMELGREWWPAVFDGMDSQGLRAVLEEMVGLGVLLREEKGQIRQYRLRSPNLLRLLGPKEAIEGELEKLIALDRPNRLNPRNFRAKIDPQSAQFGPLSKEQEGQIADTTHPFGLTIVRGNSALGLREVGQHVRKLMQDLAELAASGEDWQERPLRNVGGALTTERVLEQLREVFKPRIRKHRYVLLDFEELAFDGRLEELFERMLSEIGKICRRESRGKVIVVLGPIQTWEWVSSETCKHTESNSRVVSMTVRRWSDGAIANALDNINLRTSSKMAGRDIFKLTAGIHSMVSQALRQAASLRGDAKRAVDIAERVKTEFIKVPNKPKLLEDLGIVNMEGLSTSQIRDLFDLREEIDGSACLTKDSIELAIEMFHQSGKSLPAQLVHHILSWLQSLNIIWPANEVRVKLGAEYEICPWTAELLGA